MLDSGVRLAAASLPVGVPVVVGLVVAVLRRRELPAVSTPAIAGLAVQLVVVLISTFLVAATSFDAFSLSPETLLPLSSVLGFVVILLQVVSWTLLLIALFRRLPGPAPAPAPAEDRTPTGRHALVDHRGDQVIAEAGTTFLPIGAGASAASRTEPATGPRPVTGPPTGPHGAPQGPPPGPPPGPPYRTTTVRSPGARPGPPLPSIPVPVADATAPGGAETAAVEAVEADDTVEAVEPPEDAITAGDESANTETIQAYREPADATDATDDAADDEVVEVEEVEEETAEDGGESPGAGDAVDAPTSGASTPQDTPGEDVDEEPAADVADTVDAAASGDAGDEQDDPADPEPDAPARTDGAAGGHPWFDPDGEAARSSAQPGPR